MIRPLRLVHRATWPVLAAILALLVLSALAARRPVPIVPAARPFEPTGSDRSILVPAEALRGRPELVAYFIADGAELRIERGTLVGTVRGGEALRLPDAVGTVAGTLALYDLAHGEIVATVRVPARGAP
jgi:hypothetical protein